MTNRDEARTEIQDALNDMAQEEHDRFMEQLAQERRDALLAYEAQFGCSCGVVDCDADEEDGDDFSGDEDSAADRMLRDMEPDYCYSDIEEDFDF